MSTTETVALLVEIGCEEIPARFLQASEREFGERLAAELRAARILDAGTPVKTGSTPRRLVAYAPALLQRQADQVNLILGPPAKAAFDPHGKPTRAAEAFAAKQHVSVSDLRRIQQAKGEYLAAEVREPGLGTSRLLRELLPRVIGSISFPKSMYWTSKAGPRFVRPIRWILALLDEEQALRVIPFEFAGVKSGSYTFGHRLKGLQPIEVRDLNHDLKLLDYWVEIHTAKRRQRIRNEVKELVEGRGLVVSPDEFLEDWMANSTEWPTALLGCFDRRYLALPREVLVTVMRDHQKYFAIEDKAGNLQPYFITVLNAPDDRKGSIRQGHERVLAARFTDAEFFWNADQKISLAARIPMLERVIYHEKLGTYGDKVRRMKVLAARICDELEKRGVPSVEQRGHALRAVDLCKCDLTTQMVQEFPELQGVIGGLYAQAQGEIQVLADAIYDQYKPVNVEDSCPRAAPGAIVSLADKLDSVVAGFSTGLEPTGSSDPFGLRRAGNGVIKLCLEALQGLDLWSLARGHADYVKQVLAGQAIDASWPRVEDFLRERMEFYFREVAGLRYDTARAVLRSTRVLREQGRLGHSGPADALSRAKALESVRDTDDFLALAAAAKRTRNIRKSATEADVADGPPDETQFTEERERELYKAYKSLRELLDVLTAGGKYEEAFRAMATIRPQVDLFFDKVLVMTEDRAVRRNRLRLLYWLHEDVFTSLADLAEITVESPAGAATGS